MDETIFKIRGLTLLCIFHSVFFCSEYHQTRYCPCYENDQTFARFTTLTMATLVAMSTESTSLPKMKGQKAFPPLMVDGGNRSMLSAILVKLSAERSSKFLIGWIDMPPRTLIKVAQYISRRNSEHFTQIYRATDCRFVHHQDISELQ